MLRGDQCSDSCKPSSARGSETLSRKPARCLLEQLQAALNVERFEAYGLDAELEVGDLARPLVSSRPKGCTSRHCLYAFPGIRVRVDRWLSDGFPALEHSSEPERQPGRNVINVLPRWRLFQESAGKEV
jgi:hypothetical protein